ncbi:hypothetical protein K2173_000310 [Erythroxylum novogranatense]|uniref:Calmodulin-binding domain-containing protein n=1 Tax=Erythroxylum novogranatense TaxID=1862640 RepID=A0AAV8SX31_9ROSI|nr:hypothetical protein K2173_000310 [Erythroxylum novogranatense]
MATKAKTESSNLKKEKKVTPSSNSQATLKQGNPRPSSSGSVDRKSSSSSGRAVPNYLKPTVSSRSESLKYVKKPANEDSQKAALVRRRSFDRPPSATRVQSSIVSPDPKHRDRTLTRSSTVSPKNTPSPKPALERNSRSLKLVKSQTPPSRTVKRSASPSRRASLPTNPTKNVANSSASMKEIGDNDIFQTLDLEIKQVYNNELLHEPEKTLSVDSEVQVDSDVLETEDKEHINAADTQVSNEEDEKYKTPDVSTVSDGLSVPQVSENEELVNEIPEEGASNPQEIKEFNNKEENRNYHNEEVITEEDKVEADQEQLEQNVNENAEQEADEKKDEDSNQVEEESEEIKSKEGQDLSESVVEAKPEATDSVPQNLQVGQGKKESPAAYNDVIEETKNKLLEKRKNKVKALVGAFETVIDYESAGSK